MLMKRSDSTGSFKLFVSLVVAALVAGLAGPSGAYIRPGKNELVSASSYGTVGHTAIQGNGSPTTCGTHSFVKLVDMTPKARYVTFSSAAHDLVPGDTNGACDVFVRDRKDGATERVSVSSLGLQALVGGVPADCGGGSSEASLANPGPISTGVSISASGRFVAFQSAASDLVVGDTNLACDVFVHDRKHGETTRISVASDGSQAVAPFESHNSRGASISGDGRFVTFYSFASDLVVGDTNNEADVFVHDRRTKATERVSVGPGGIEADRQSRWPFLSPNGRLVVFTSEASNLLAEDTGTAQSVFVHDRKTHKNDLISITSDGSRGGGSARDVESRPVSDDGRYAVFTSSTANFSRPDTHYVPNDTNTALGFPAIDVFVRDRKTQRIERVSVRSDGGEAAGPSGAIGAISISSDGRYVSFDSQAPNLFPGDTSGVLQRALLLSDIDGYVYDRKTGALEWVSVSDDGQEAQYVDELGALQCGSAYPGPADATGRYVSFWSCAENLVRDDTDEQWHLIVRDRGAPLGVGEMVASGQVNRLSLEGDPHFAHSGVAFINDVGNDALTGTLSGAGELIGARIAYRPLLDDLFVVLELESMPPTPALAAVTAGTVYGMSFTLDRSFYEIRSVSTGLGANGETTAVFGLFSCGGEAFGLGCDKVADLAGGFGTTGERITFSVPLDALSIVDGSVISDVHAFTALGSYWSGRIRLIDELRP